MRLTELFNPENSRRLIIGGFLMVPALTSFISAIHIYEFFILGNPMWMALTLAIAYELGSLASFLVLTVMDKINKYIVWSIFILLAFMQITGNFYAVFDFINRSLQTDPKWLSSFQELFSYFIDGDAQTFKVLLTTIIGIPISLISLAFLKSLVDYVPSVKEVKVEEVPVVIVKDEHKEIAPVPTELPLPPVITAAPEVEIIASEVLPLAHVSAPAKDELESYTESQLREQYSSKKKDTGSGNVALQNNIL